MLTEACASGPGDGWLPWLPAVSRALGTNGIVDIGDASSSSDFLVEIGDLDNLGLRHALQHCAGLNSQASKTARQHGKAS